MLVASKVTGANLRVPLGPLLCMSLQLLGSV